MSRLFGWSLPPGCHSVPGDEPDPPCYVCGNEIGLCIIVTVGMG